MITDNLQAVLNWFTYVRTRFNRTVSEGIEEELDRLIQGLRPVTPVDTGAMESRYYISTTGPGSWQLIDTAESPQGYDYPMRVFEDPAWSRQYMPLNEALDAGIDHIESELDVVIQRMVS